MLKGSMRVCLDCTPFLGKSAGIKSYLYYLYSSMRECAGSRKLSAYPFLQNPGVLRHDQSTLNRFSTLCRAVVVGSARFSWCPLLELAAGKADVFHASNLIVRGPRRAVLTTTVHDLTTWLMPELHMARTVATDRIFFASVVDKAKRIIADSENTKKDLIRLRGIAESRIEVIYPGIDEAFFLGDPADGAARRERYGLKKPYLLSVGTLEPRKNIGRLLDAYSGLKPSLRVEHDLILVGMEGWLSPREMNQLRGGMAGVRWLDYVPREDLLAIIGGATLCVYASLYEGFGFPVVECMAAGVPVITSRAGSLPEVCGDAAVLVDPLSVEEIRAAIERLLLSPEASRRMIELGRKQAQRYRWENTARRTWTFFESVVDG
jgi:glycosyltransferase involved in cell wall biosynthesis